MRKHLTIGDGIAQDALERIAFLCESSLGSYEQDKDKEVPAYWNGYLASTLRWILRNIETAETVTAEMARFAELD